MPDSSKLGFFGNVWVRENHLGPSRVRSEGHKHAFDHLSMLVEGTVRVHVEGYEPKEFTAPTFIIIRKEHNHAFERLTPTAIWYCVFALRDFEGEVIEDLYGREHDPLSYDAVDDDYWERAEALDKLTTHEVAE